MPGELVEPRTTLAIVLGASEWPLSPNLPASEAFTNAAQGFLKYLRANDGFNLPFDNLLNLFDLERSPDDIDRAISKFLIERQEQLAKAGTAAKNLIVYYVGHGGFTPGQQEYFLAIRSTRQDREGASSIRIADLARTLKQDARSLRRYLIFDCCFAAAAFKEFQSSGPAQAARRKTLEEFPKKGTALLCAASARDVAVAPRGKPYTMFSGALLDILRRGDPKLDTSFTLAQLGERVWQKIHDDSPDDAVRPEVLSPDQREGDIADIPLFPNLGLRPRQLDDRLTYVEQTIEIIMQKLSDINNSVSLVTSVQRKIAGNEAQRGNVDTEDVTGLTDIERKSEQKDWLKASMPPDIQLDLRVHRLALIAGIAWLGCSLVICGPTLYSLLTYNPLFKPSFTANPWYGLVTLSALYSAWVLFRSTVFGVRFFKLVTLGESTSPIKSAREETEGEEPRPWERLPEVIAMRSTKTYSALGSIRIASPLFEIGATLFFITATLYILTIVSPMVPGSDGFGPK